MRIFTVFNINSAYLWGFGASIFLALALSNLLRFPSKGSDYYEKTSFRSRKWTKIPAALSLFLILAFVSMFLCELDSFLQKLFWTVFAIETGFFLLVFRLIRFWSLLLIIPACLFLILTVTTLADHWRFWQEPGTVGSVKSVSYSPGSGTLNLTDPQGRVHSVKPQDTDITLEFSRITLPEYLFLKAPYIYCLTSFSGPGTVVLADPDAKTLERWILFLLRELGWFSVNEYVLPIAEIAPLSEYSVRISPDNQLQLIIEEPN